MLFIDNQLIKNKHIYFCLNCLILLFLTAMHAILPIKDKGFGNLTNCIFIISSGDYAPDGQYFIIQ